MKAGAEVSVVVDGGVGQDAAQSVDLRGSPEMDDPVGVCLESPRARGSVASASGPDLDFQASEANDDDDDDDDEGEEGLHRDQGGEMGNDGSVREPRQWGSKLGFDLSEWRRFRVERAQKRATLRNRHSYKQYKSVPDAIVSGRRKKKSALHGTGVSKWYEAKNWYYVLLDWSWTYLFVLITAWYLVTTIFWSLISWTMADSIECEVGHEVFLQGTFGIACVFTTSNILTLGYGPCLPASYGLYAIACIQQYVGLLLSVIVLSVVVSKFQIPKPDILFSKNALITTRNGQPVLLIRVGNRRVNLLYETRVTVAVLQGRSTREGERYVEYVPLKVLFPPNMTAVATIVHRIDHESPLRRLLLEQTELANVAFSVSFLGHDSVYNDELSCTTQYKGSDIKVGGILFGDMMERMTGGKGMRANFDRFDYIVEAGNVTMDDLLAALGPDSELDSTDEEGGLVLAGGAIRDPKHLVRPTRSSSGHMRGKKSRAARASKVPFNDVTLEPSILRLPEDAARNEIFLCMGCVLFKNRLVRLCPYSRKVYMFLSEAGISFKVIDIDWNNKPDWFLEASAAGHTPVLRLKGRWIAGSHQIMRALNKAFPDQAAQINRPHDLPLRPFNFADLLDKHGFPIAFSAPDRVAEMLAAKKGDGLTTCVPITLDARALARNPRNSPRLGEQTKMHHDERVWHDRPPDNSSELYLTVFVRHRGDRLVRCCVFPQAVEMLLRLAGVRYHAVLVDEEDPPDWVEDMQPTLLGPGPESRVTKGVNAILDLLHGTLYPERLASLPRRTSMQELQATSTRIYDAAKAYLLRKQEQSSPEEAAIRRELDALEESLAEVGEGPAPASQKSGLGLTWTPFLCRADRAGMDDVLLAPVVRYVTQFVLKELCGFDLVAQGYPRLQAYVTGISRTSLFRGTTLSDAPASFFALNIVKALSASLGATAVPPRCRVTEALRAAEEVNVKRMYAEYGMDTMRIEQDGSITLEGGLSGPAMEMNRLYLAVGCVKRGSDLAKCCPFSRVIEMIASEARIPHNVVLIDLMNKPEWFKSASNGKAPNAYWNGTWHSESSVIIEIIRHLFPDDMARIERPLDLGLGGLHAMDLFNEADRRFEPYMTAKTNDPERESKLNTMLDLLQAMEACLEASSTPFMSGTEVPCVDEIALVCSVWRIVKVSCGWFHNFSFMQHGLHGVQQWLETMGARESFTNSVPPFPEPFIIYYNSKFYGDTADPDHSPMVMTPGIKSAEKDALARLRVKRHVDRPGNPAEDRCMVVQFEALLRIIEECLQHQAGGFLCGDALGLADILVVCTLSFFDEAFDRLHGFTIASRGFPLIGAYLNRVRSTPRFCSVFSPALGELFMIHFSDRLSTPYPHLRLNREARETLERQALNKLETLTKRRRFAHSSSETERSSNTSVGAASSGSSTDTDVKADMEDLLFCI